MLFLKKFFFFLDDQSNKNWLFIFLGFSFYIVFMLSIKFYQQYDDWTSFHLSLFITSFFLFLYIILGGIVKPFPLVIIFLATWLLDVKKFLGNIADWTFFSSPLQPFFNHLVVKDTNVFLVLCFLFLGSICILKIIYTKITTKKFNFSLIFTTLTIFSFLFITLIFHYVLIEKYYKKIISNEMSHVENIFQIKDKELFENICSIQGYICTYDGGIDAVANKTKSSKFKEVLTPYISTYVIEGNFPIDLSKNEIYLVVSDGKKWIIEQNIVGKSFAFSETLLMFSLTFAHSFWLLFYIWLLLFHNRRIFNKKV